MIGNPHYSVWGIKDNGEDITRDILGIINNASSYIVVGGYNFTFQTSGYTFFNLLTQKASTGIPVLMIIPPNLSSPLSNQAQIIQYCISHGIALILNGNNHSKWLLTENDLYYGSSNFTQTSWRHRVEVVTIHRHSNIFRQWMNDTLLDFRLFIQREISRISRRRTMTNIQGLVSYTLSTWNQLLTLILRFNPSIQKAIITLKNFHEVEQLLNSIIEDWFLFYNKKVFEEIYKFNRDIFIKINQLYEFAYFNIYNETIGKESIINDNIVEKYNMLYDELSSEIKEKSKLFTFHLSKIETIQPDKEILSKNEELIDKIYEKINMNT